MPHNVCSYLTSKTREIIKLIMYMILDIGQYRWMPGIGHAVIHRYIGIL